MADLISTSMMFFDGAQPSVYAVPAETQKMLVVDIGTLVRRTSNGGGLEDFLKSFEADANEQKLLANGRKWVAESFYQGPDTLASLRLKAGLSQKQLAVACGMKQPHVSKYELAEVEPGISVAKRFAIALGVTLDDFYSAWEETSRVKRGALS